MCGAVGVDFGAPAPLIDSSAKAPTLNVNGDGTFFSGVYANGLLDARDGVGLDVELSTPVTMGQGQLIVLGLSPSSDSTRLAEWDHVTGWPRFGSDCMFQYPAGPDGDTKADFMYGYVANLGAAVAAPPELRTGKRYHVRLQILPDGRCVTALNGKVIGVSRVDVARDRAAPGLLLRQQRRYQGARRASRDLQGRARESRFRRDCSKHIALTAPAWVALSRCGRRTRRVREHREGVTQADAGKKELSRSIACSRSPRAPSAAHPASSSARRAAPAASRSTTLAH